VDPPRGGRRPHGAVAVLSLSGAGISTVLTGTDTATGRALWSSADWARGAQGSRSALVATGAGHGLIQTTRSDLAGDSTSLLVRDLRTGRPVGRELPQPVQPAARTDTTNDTAVVYEKTEAGAATGAYGLDMTSGRPLWRLGKTQSVTAVAAGSGVAWLQGTDGHVAVDDRTGKVRATSLPGYPLLVLPSGQVHDEGQHGLELKPLS